ncbi:MAG: ATP-binding protein [candidate division NC10 bacterium]|nr:ATP-binding protein [candidate division NC10 bacterium]
MVSITIGPPATGEDFFDREPLLEDIWEAVSKGSVLLAAPRRVGKTSVMLRMRDNPPEEYMVFYIEAEDFSASEELVTDLMVKIVKVQPKLQRFIKDILSGLASSLEELEVWEIRLKLREHLRGHWKEKGTQAIQEVLSLGPRCLLLIDELSILLHKLGVDPKSLQEATELLHWLRGLRQEFTGRLSMVLGSSVGIGRIAAHLGASRTINDLRQIEVGAFDPLTARQFAESLLESRGLEVDEETLQALLSQVETYIPIFIQIMVDALSKEVRNQKVEASPELIRWCYEERVHGPEFRTHFEDYYERLNRYYTPNEAKAGKRILRDLAISEQGISRSALHDAVMHELGPAGDSEQFDLLLAALENDFYVTVGSREERVKFHNKWLRDWWRRYHGLGS